MKQEKDNKTFNKRKVLIWSSAIAGATIACLRNIYKTGHYFGPVLGAVLVLLFLAFIMRKEERDIE